MFSNTAYEALYEMIGLRLHSEFISLITSESFFKGLILLIFGFLFFLTVVKFISRHIPGSIVERRHVPLSKFVKIIVCLFLGLSILRVGGTASVHDYKGQNWADNDYVRSHLLSDTSEYRVSLVYLFLTNVAEEFAALLNRVIDTVMVQQNSQLEAPDYFYKAIMYAGTSTIEEPELRDEIAFYTDECFAKVLSSVKAEVKDGVGMDWFYVRSSPADKALEGIELQLPQGAKTNCLAVKESVRTKLMDYASRKATGLPALPETKTGASTIQPDYRNLFASNQLVNYYMNQHESGVLGLQKGADIPGPTGSFFRSLARTFGWDGLLGLSGHKNLFGAAEAAERSQAFSEHLARAPHIAGIAKATLTFIFPWLMFFVVAGRWQILVSWFAIYLSILLWAPLWTLLYHLMLNVALSADMLEAFGKMNDGISLYSAAIVNSRIYYMYSVYSWLQLLVASLTTGTVFIFLKPMLGHSTQEESPEFIGTARGIAGQGVEVASAKSAAGVAAAVL